MHNNQNKEFFFDDIQNELGKNLANSLINISLVDNFIWVKNPKVASSTLDTTLQSVSSRKLGSIAPKPHSQIENSVFVKPFQMSDTDLHSTLLSAAFYRFTFARNPYQRVFSAYVDKIAGDKPNKVQILKYAGLDTKDIAQKVTFEQYIDALADIKPNKMDRHWMPQSLLTCVKYLKYDFIGKIENFNEDLKVVFEHINLDIDDYYTYYAPHKNRKKASIKDHLSSQETLDKINLIYKDDFEAFDYDMMQSISDFAQIKAA